MTATTNGHTDGAATNGTAHSATAKPDHFSTRAIHVGSTPNAATGAVIPPLSLSTTYAQSSIGVHSGFEYARSSNPNRLDFETVVASLEGAHDLDAAEASPPLPRALAVSSGSAATATVIGATVGMGGHIVSMSDVYGGTYRYLTKVAKELGMESTFVDMSFEGDPDAPGAREEVEARVKAAIKENTRLIWIETPTNPTLRLVDISLIASIGRLYNIPVAVDNTFMTPFYQQPLSLGATIVVHSGTKYLGGHSDVIIGLIITNSPTILAKARFLQNAHGAVPSPFDCWLCQRSLKTLPLRMREHGRNGLAVAQWLQTTGQERGWVAEVAYNGLKGAKGANLAWRQLPDDTREQLTAAGFSPATGFPHSGMVSFRIARPAGVPSSSSAAAERFLENTKLFTLAESLGGVESLAELPVLMTHSSVAEEDRAKLGIDGALVRLSVGVEDVRDLIADVEQALRIAVGDADVKELKKNGVH